MKRVVGTYRIAELVEGEKELQLTVFTPDTPPQGSIFFFHAGGFTSGRRDSVRTENVAKAICERGYAVIVPSYRLRRDNGLLDRLEPYRRKLRREANRRALDIPQHRINRIAMAATEDAAAAVTWWREHRQSFGVETAKIRLWGNSVGGLLVMNLLFLRDLLALDVDDVESASIFAGGYFYAMHRASSAVPVHAWHNRHDAQMPFSSVELLAARPGVDLDLTVGDGTHHGFVLDPADSPFDLIDAALDKRVRATE